MKQYGPDCSNTQHRIYICLRPDSRTRLRNFKVTSVAVDALSRARARAQIHQSRCVGGWRALSSVQTKLKVILRPKKIFKFIPTNESLSLCYFFCLHLTFTHAHSKLCTIQVIYTSTCETAVLLKKIAKIATSNCDAPYIRKCDFGSWIIGWQTKPDYTQIYYAQKFHVTILQINENLIIGLFCCCQSRRNFENNRCCFSVNANSQNRDLCALA